MPQTTLEAVESETEIPKKYLFSRITTENN